MRPKSGREGQRNQQDLRPLTFDPEGEIIIYRVESLIFPHIPTPFSPSCAFILS
jgi:hypothetical protein